jgi:EF hand
MKTSSIICSGALIALISLPGLGQNPESDKDTTRTKETHSSAKDSHKSHSEKRFGDHKFMDLDKDGRVSKSEYEQAFSKFDANGDGYLTSDELRRGSHSASASDSAASNDSRSRSSDSKDPQRKPDSTRQP